MASLNRVMIIGRLGKDVELRYTQGGKACANMTIATDESYKDQQGNKIERTEWHRVTAWGTQAEPCANYLAKGSQVYVEGNLTTRKYTDQQGIERYTTEINAQRVQFLDRKKDGQVQTQQPQRITPPRTAPARDPNTNLGPAFTSESDKDEIPF